MDLANKSTDQYEYSKSYSAPCEDPRPLPLPHQTTYLLSFAESAPPPAKISFAMHRNPRSLRTRQKQNDFTNPHETTLVCG